LFSVIIQTSSLGWGETRPFTDATSAINWSIVAVSDNR
jgi:hypothetical protein